MSKWIHAVLLTSLLGGCADLSSSANRPNAPTSTTTFKSAEPLNNTDAKISTQSKNLLVEASQIKCEDVQNPAYRASLLKAINDIRAKRQHCGSTVFAPTTALVWQPILAKSSLSHANYLASTGKISHQGAKGETLRMRMMAAGYLSGGGENVAARQANLSQVMDNWLTLSASHCTNLMQPKYQAYAIACVMNPKDQRGYWVQHFGQKK